MNILTTLSQKMLIRLMMSLLVLILITTGTVVFADPTTSSGPTATLMPVEISNNAGAHLPINYNLAGLKGSIFYAAPGGSSSSNCSVTTPCSVARAISYAPSGTTIVLRGGKYRDQRNISIDKSGLTLIAYPGEIPEFRGSIDVPTSGWIQEGSNKYRSYTPRPVTDSDIKFGSMASANQQSGCTNLTGDCVGMFPDQVWIGSTPLRQVRSKSQLADGKFFADSANKRLYLTANDAAKSNIESSRSSTGASDRDRLFGLNASNITIKGIRVTRFSPSAGEYGVICIGEAAHKALLEDIEISHIPYDGIRIGAGNTGSTIKNMTISYVAWQGINANQTDNFTLDSSKITDGDFFDEFSSSPASGAVKTSRNRNTTIKNSLFKNNKSHGLWFDQSNMNIVVANSAIIDNKDSGVFFEISDGLLLVNNYIRSIGASTGLRLIGSSGLKLVNNTSIGGASPVGIYTDPRSLPGCSTRPTTNPCQLSGDVQRRYPRPASMDWMPRLDLMVNNIFANPTGTTSLCSNVSTTMCFMTSHGAGGKAPMNTIIHKADSLRGIPQTYMDGNVYSNGSGAIARVTQPGTTYSSISDFSATMKSQTSISVDANGRSGAGLVNADGTPSSVIASSHNRAVSVPSDATINLYVPAGTRHYGALTGRSTSTPTTTVPITTTTPGVTTTKPGVTTTKPVVTTTKPVVTTTKPGVTTTKPGVTTTKPVVTTTTVPPKPPITVIVPSNVDTAIKSMISEYGLSKFKVTEYDSSTKVLNGRAYFPKYKFLYLAVDISATISSNGQYRVTVAEWIVSLAPIR